MISSTGSDIVFSAFGQLDRTDAAVRTGALRSFLLLFDGSAQGGLTDIEISRCLGKTAFFVNFINVMHRMEHNRAMPPVFSYSPIIAFSARKRNKPEGGEKASKRIKNTLSCLFWNRYSIIEFR